MRLVTEWPSGVVTETELTCIERNEQIGLAELGLRLDEAKRVTKALQAEMVPAQMTALGECRRACEACGRRLASKGHSAARFRSLFGDVPVQVRRLLVCSCQGASESETQSVAVLSFGRDAAVAPELAYVTARYAAMAPFGKTADLLSELLPITGTQHASTVRSRTLRVGAEIVQAHAAETANQPTAPASGPVVVGIDGGYLRHRHRAEGRRFEVIAGKVIQADGAQHRFAFTRTGPTATAAAFRAALAAAGVDAHTPATVLCDGDAGLWQLQRKVLPGAVVVLDWWHAAVRFEHALQAARSLGAGTAEASLAATAVRGLERAKWRLWHGRWPGCRRKLTALCRWAASRSARDVAGIDKLRQHAADLFSYLERNEAALVHYAARRRRGELIATSFVESAVDEIISWRMAKAQQMRWSRATVPGFLNVRTAVLNDTLEDACAAVTQVSGPGPRTTTTGSPRRRPDHPKTPHGGAHVEEGLHGRPAPAHLLLFVHTLGHDLVDRAFHERGRDRLTSPTPGSVVHQGMLVALEIAQQLACVLLEAADAGHVSKALALRPAAQGRELASAPGPAPVPQAPLCPLQAANRRVGKVRIGRTRAETTRWLQRVLEAHRGVPPVQHDRGTGQHGALQPPQSRIAVAQHGRQRVRVHSGRGERLPERLGRDRLAVAGEGEAVLGAAGRHDLARDHLEMALLLPVPAAHIAAIEPNHHRARRLRRGLLRAFGDMLVDDLLAHAQRPVPDRARVLRPTHRQQLRQESRDLAEGHQRRIPSRHVGQLWCDGILAQVQRGETLCFTRALTRADEQPADAHRYVAEQGAKPRPIMTLAGQHAPARDAQATAFTHDIYLGRHDLSLECCRELLRLGELKPKLGQAGLLLALDAGHLGFRHHPRPQLRNQLHPPHQLRHQPTLVP